MSLKKMTTLGNPIAAIFHGEHAVQTQFVDNLSAVDVRHDIWYFLHGVSLFLMFILTIDDEIKYKWTGGTRFLFFGRGFRMKDSLARIRKH